MRIALGLEYDGSAFHGWQAQQLGIPTVQRAVEGALAQIAAHPLTVIAAGRTDAGVHAGGGGGSGQVIHFDTGAIRPIRAWIRGGNSLLPPTIGITWAKAVPDSFHARFSALSRRYRYLIYNNSIRPTLARNRVCWEYRPLDTDAMSFAASQLLGTHDFSSYRAQGCQAHSPIRTLHKLEVSRQRGEFGELIIIEAIANAFLQHMVRNIAGVLLAIGAGERPPTWAGEVLEYRNRAQGGVTAPPEGLYLVGAEYQPCYAIGPDHSHQECQ